MTLRARHLAVEGNSSRLRHAATGGATVDTHLNGGTLAPPVAEDVWRADAPYSAGEPAVPEFLSGG